MYLEYDMSMSQAGISGVESERPLLTPPSFSDKVLLYPTLAADTSDSLSQGRLPSESDLLMSDLKITKKKCLHKSFPPNEILGS